MARTPLYVLVVLTSYQAGTYGIFMKLSGLSQQRFAMVSLIVGTTPFAKSVELRSANCIVRPRCAVTLTVLATICFLACVFYVCVLFQWMRDTKRTTTTRPGMDNDVDETCEKKRLHIVGSRRAAERQDRMAVRSHRVPTWTEGSLGPATACHECERIAYERIARSLSASEKK